MAEPMSRPNDDPLIMKTADQQRGDDRDQHPDGRKEVAAPRSVLFAEQLEAENEKNRRDDVGPIDAELVMLFSSSVLNIASMRSVTR